MWDSNIMKTTFHKRYGLYVLGYVVLIDYASTIFMDLMNMVFRPYEDKFVVVFIDDILVYSHSVEELRKYL